MTGPTDEHAMSHYFDASPTVASSPRDLEVFLPEGRLLRFVADRGTFSPDRLDPGTRLLLTEAPDPVGSVLADVGCGWGAIAVTMALRNPDAIVWAVDSNERARALCRQNADRNGVGERVRVAAPDEVPSDLVVDVIWSNPPIRIGKRALDELIRSWLARLAPTGSAELVVQRNLGADSLARRLGDRWTVTRRTSRAGYRVLSVTAPEASP